MVIEKLVSKHCIVCNVRCDKIGKHNLMEVKHQEMLAKIMFLERNNDNVPDIGDLMCRKHEKKITRAENQLHIESSTTINATSISTFASSSSVLNDFDTSNYYDENDHFSSNNIDTCEKIEEEVETIEINQNFIIVDMPRTYASHSFCFICKVKVKSGIHTNKFASLTLTYYIIF